MAPEAQTPQSPGTHPVPLGLLPLRCGSGFAQRLDTCLPCEHCVSVFIAMKVSCQLVRELGLLQKCPECGSVAFAQQVLWVWYSLAVVPPVMPGPTMNP